MWRAAVCAKAIRISKLGAAAYYKTWNCFQATDHHELIQQATDLGFTSQLFRFAICAAAGGI